jgi:hypothetical protein
LTNRIPRLATATLLYLSLTLILTWPLARGLARDVPGDFGDPILNAWILAWDDTHLGRGLWSANIFYPHPLALAYSEHLLPQALEILPVYATTRNPILCYNLLFLSTFVLSGLGMYLLVRELTGDSAAALVAGVAFAFTPYRISSIPHLQVLSSQWMPFALYGFRRYFVTGRAMPLVGGTAAWILQNLSCGYYLLFFSPVLALYVAWEMTTRGLWTNRQKLASMAGAFAITALVCFPFLQPYLELRQSGSSPRSLNESIHFSADVYSYLTADSNLRLWGSTLRAWPSPEGSLFLGASTVALAVMALIASLRQTVTRFTGWLLVVTGTLIIGLLFGWTIRFPIGTFASVKITDLWRTAFVAGVLLVALLSISAQARRGAREWMKAPTAIFSLLTIVAAFMSFGPDIRAKGRIIEAANIYGFFYHYVPGFDGLRVPARFGMVVAFGTTVLAGLGLSRLLSALPRRGFALCAGVLIIAESFAAPISINQTATTYNQAGLAALPDTVSVFSAPSVYRFLSTLPDSSAVVELPLGEPAFDVRYMFYSTLHWKRLVNGYSGGAPLAYEQLTSALEDVLMRPERGWQLLSSTGATHVIVHEAFYSGDRGLLVSQWLRDHAAREVATFESDHVFQLH